MDASIHHLFTFPAFSKSCQPSDTFLKPFWSNYQDPNHQKLCPYVFQPPGICLSSFFSWMVLHYFYLYSFCSSRLDLGIFVFLLFFLKASRWILFFFDPEENYEDLKGDKTFRHTCHDLGNFDKCSSSTREPRYPTFCWKAKTRKNLVLRWFEAEGIYMMFENHP